MMYWVARMPFEVRSWAKRMAGVRLQNRPTEPRTAVFSSVAQETLSRGEMLLLESGILPFSLNEPLALTSFWLRTGAFGLSRFSQRTPAVTVRLGRTSHWSCRKKADSFWRNFARPAWSAVRPLRPPNWRNWAQRPASRSSFVLKTETPRQFPL